MKIENEYGTIEILEKLPQNKVIFKCHCGKISTASLWKLKNGIQKSCKCKGKPNYTGQKFGKLTVIKFIKNKGWFCECSCGGSRYTDADNFKKGLAKSCGCIRTSENNQLFKQKIYKRWQSICNKNLQSEEFKDFYTFNDYIYNNLKPIEKDFRIYRIDKNKLFERNNIEIKSQTHIKNFYGHEFKWCTSCKKYIKISEKFWNKSKKLQSCKLCKFKKSIKKKFNLDYLDYLKMIKSCKNKCEICKTDLLFLISKRTGNIDHCHKTNIVRGILCSNCNLGLGMFKDDINCIKNAIKYLKRGDTKFKYKTINNKQIENICPITGLKNNLCCDHNHKTGFIRGNIDNLINAGIGKFKDSVEILENAIKYLEKERN